MTPFRLLFSPMDAAGRQSRNTPAACFSRRLPLSPRALPSIRAEMHDHVHVHASRQAVVDGGRPPPGVRINRNRRINPMQSKLPV
jgi:hypothetical protein